MSIPEPSGMEIWVNEAYGAEELELHSPARGPSTAATPGELSPGIRRSVSFSVASLARSTCRPLPLLTASTCANGCDEQALPPSAGPTNSPVDEESASLSPLRHMVYQLVDEAISRAMPHALPFWLRTHRMKPCKAGDSTESQGSAEDMQAPQQPVQQDAASSAASTHAALNTTAIDKVAHPCPHPAHHSSSGASRACMQQAGPEVACVGREHTSESSAGSAAAAAELGTATARVPSASTATAAAASEYPPDASICVPELHSFHSAQPCTTYPHTHSATLSSLSTSHFMALQPLSCSNASLSCSNSSLTFSRSLKRPQLRKPAFSAMPAPAGVQHSNQSHSCVHSWEDWDQGIQPDVGLECESRCKSTQPDLHPGLSGCTSSSGCAPDVSSGDYGVSADDSQANSPQTCSISPAPPAATDTDLPATSADAIPTLSSSPCPLSPRASQLSARTEFFTPGSDHHTSCAHHHCCHQQHYCTWDNSPSQAPMPFPSTPQHGPSTSHLKPPSPHCGPTYASHFSTSAGSTAGEVTCSHVPAQFNSLPPDPTVLPNSSSCSLLMHHHPHPQLAWPPLFPVCTWDSANAAHPHYAGSMHAAVGRACSSQACRSQVCSQNLSPATLHLSQLPQNQRQGRHPQHQYTCPSPTTPPPSTTFTPPPLDNLGAVEKGVAGLPHLVLEDPLPPSLSTPTSPHTHQFALPLCPQTPCSDSSDGLITRHFTAMGSCGSLSSSAPATPLFSSPLAEPLFSPCCAHQSTPLFFSPLSIRRLGALEVVESTSTHASSSSKRRSSSGTTSSSSSNHASSHVVLPLWSDNFNMLRPLGPPGAKPNCSTSDVATGVTVEPGAAARSGMALAAGQAANSAMATVAEAARVGVSGGTQRTTTTTTTQGIHAYAEMSSDDMTGSATFASSSSDQFASGSSESKCRSGSWQQAPSGATSSVGTASHCSMSSSCVGGQACDAAWAAEGTQLSRHGAAASGLRQTSGTSTSLHPPSDFGQVHTQPCSSRNSGSSCSSAGVAARRPSDSTTAQSATRTCDAGANSRCSTQVASRTASSVTGSSGGGMMTSNASMAASSHSSNSKQSSGSSQVPNRAPRSAATHSTSSGPAANPAASAPYSHVPSHGSAEGQATPACGVPKGVAGQPGTSMACAVQQSGTAVQSFSACTAYARSSSVDSSQELGPGTPTTGEPSTRPGTATVMPASAVSQQLPGQPDSSTAGEAAQGRNCPTSTEATTPPQPPPLQPDVYPAVNAHPAVLRLELSILQQQVLDLAETVSGVVSNSVLTLLQAEQRLQEQFDTLRNAMHGQLNHTRALVAHTQMQQELQHAAHQQLVQQVHHLHQELAALRGAAPPTTVHKSLDVPVKAGGMHVPNIPSGMNVDNPPTAGNDADMHLAGGTASRAQSPSENRDAALQCVGNSISIRDSAAAAAGGTPGAAAAAQDLQSQLVDVCLHRPATPPAAGHRSSHGSEAAASNVTSSEKCWHNPLVGDHAAPGTAAWLRTRRSGNLPSHCTSAYLGRVQDGWRAQRGVAHSAAGLQQGAACGALHTQHGQVPAHDVACSARMQCALCCLQPAVPLHAANLATGRGYLPCPFHPDPMLGMTPQLGAAPQRHAQQPIPHRHAGCPLQWCPSLQRDTQASASLHSSANASHSRSSISVLSLSLLQHPMATSHQPSSNRDCSDIQGSCMGSTDGHSQCRDSGDSSAIAPQPQHPDLFGSTTPLPIRSHICASTTDDPHSPSVAMLPLPPHAPLSTTKCMPSTPLSITHRLPQAPASASSSTLPAAMLPACIPFTHTTHGSPQGTTGSFSGTTSPVASPIVGSSSTTCTPDLGSASSAHSTNKRAVAAEVPAVVASGQHAQQQSGEKTRDVAQSDTPDATQEEKADGHGVPQQGSSGVEAGECSQRADGVGWQEHRCCTINGLKGEAGSREHTVHAPPLGKDSLGKDAGAEAGGMLGQGKGKDPSRSQAAQSVPPGQTGSSDGRNATRAAGGAATAVPAAVTPAACSAAAAAAPGSPRAAAAVTAAADSSAAAGTISALAGRPTAGAAAANAAAMPSAAVAAATLPPCGEVVAFVHPKHSAAAKLWRAAHTCTPSDSSSSSKVATTAFSQWVAGDAGIACMPWVPTEHAMQPLQLKLGRPAAGPSAGAATVAAAPSSVQRGSSARAGLAQGPSDRPTGHPTTRTLPGGSKGAGRMVQAIIAAIQRRSSLGD